MGCIVSKGNSKKINKKNYLIKILSLHSFDHFNLFAKNEYGNIYRVNYKSDGQPYCLKEYRKDHVIEMRALYSIMNELEFYKKYNDASRFIVGTQFAFQDDNSFYIVQEYLTGGDLGTYMKNQSFTESQAKFIFGCIILALEFLNKNSIVHGDLKPENILFEKHGYVKLNDFKKSRSSLKINFHDCDGSPGYMAPEVINRENHGTYSDIFSLGVIGYKLMLRKSPYQEESRKKYKQSLKTEVLILHHELPEHWSSFSADFFNRCLKCNKKERLGFEGFNEIKDHKWFEGFNWKSLRKFEMKPPFTPNENNKPDLKDLMIKGELNNKEYIEHLEALKTFKDYYYEYDGNLVNKQNSDV